MLKYVLLSYSVILLFVYTLYFHGNIYSAYAKLCKDSNDGNGPQSSCGSARQVHNGNSRTEASDRPHDGANDGSSDNADNQGGSNHDIGNGRQNDNHRSSGSNSKDDVPFSLPFP